MSERKVSERRVRIPLRRDVITTEAVAVGALAARHARAEHELLAAERQIEDMLDSLYGRDGWTEWEAHEQTLDVYDVLASDAAVFALQRAGFRAVTQHNHARSTFAHCACRRRESLL